ncbi:hypothetical protein ABMA32_12630 [Mesorhizobium sp. VNQ89]|uniref:hypothetical protein n=1 Tax=Mesorhizobium quangtriensis TaxID=3157709 RepID=UPI0032B7CA29
MKADDFLPGEDVIAGIKADMDRYEAERTRVHRSLLWRVPLFDGLTLLVIFGLAWLANGLAHPQELWFSTPHIFIYMFGFAALLFMHAQAVKPAKNLQQALRDRAIPVIFRFIEDIKYGHGTTPLSYERLPREMLGAFNRQQFDDVISGRYEDFPFELYEATLRQKSGKSSSEVFKGVIIAFQTPTPFKGVLFAARKSGKVAGFFRGLFGEKFKEVQSGNAALDEIYEFRTDNVAAAQPLVGGRLAQALEWLVETWPESPALVALKGDDGFLLIPQKKNFFELPGISQPLDYKLHVEPMVADMAALLATASLVRKVGGSDDQPAGPAQKE